MDAVLGTGDYRRLLAILEMVEGATDLCGFEDAVLQGLAEHLDLRCSNISLAGPPIPGNRAVAGRSLGLPAGTFEEYLECWTDHEVFASPAAGALLQRDGMARLEQVDGALDPGRLRYVNEFLGRLRIREQACLWLDTGLPTHAFVMVHRRDQDRFEARHLAQLAVLRPHLTNLLRHRLEPHVSATPPGELSTRERQVARLTAGGWSNREISRSLNISEDTVKKHVSRALAKLGVRSRTQLAVTWLTMSPAEADDAAEPAEHLSRRGDCDG